MIARPRYRLRLRLWTLLTALSCAVAQPTSADPIRADVLELRFVPTARAQLAIWIERADGTFLATVALTESVAYRGLGNRPGASQMNSGYRWPYGRREGVLPIWATRRGRAAGARQFPRVIFQNRSSEGHASQTSHDQSPDDYYCLSVDIAASRKDALDAVGCASVFNSDKGRFMTADDVAHHYGEPYLPVQEMTAAGTRVLSPTSLYPPRRDVRACGGEGGCYDHADAAQLATTALFVMPELDAVTIATPAGFMPQEILYSVPDDWEQDRYRACVEINVEGDYNADFNGETFPTPLRPALQWDAYATSYGYPYRGQPSVVYCVDFELGGDQEQRVSTADAAGSAGIWDDLDPSFGELHDLASLSDDPEGAPGSGLDRLRQMDDGARLALVVRPRQACSEDAPPSAVSELAVDRYSDELHAHEWARLRFRAAGDDHGVVRYDVRVSDHPIDDDAAFLRALPAKAASAQSSELRLPVDEPAGSPVVGNLGGLSADSHYHFAVRARDRCDSLGPLRTAAFTTPPRLFATVSPCFIATAAYGSPLAAEVGVLRRARDRYLAPTWLGRAAVRWYYQLSPRVSYWLRDHPRPRSLVRALLTPVVTAAQLLAR